MTDVFVVSGVRTAVGTFGGALKDTGAATLATAVTTEAVRRAGIEPALIGHVVFAQCAHTEPRDVYLPRIAALEAGLAIETPAFAVNRLCGSGLQAVVSAAQTILLGDAEIALAGGVEVMSRIPYVLPQARFGGRLGDGQLLDAMLAVITDPFDKVHMGITAENVASRYEISRAAQDDMAFESHRRAAQAIRDGRFASQILPLEVRQGRKTVTFATDEHVRLEAKREDFDKLRPAFKPDGGVVTAGNASGINDGAAALVLASGEAVARHRLTPLARLVAWGHAGVEPAFMGIGPVPATRAALRKADLSVDDLGVIESNEAFAAQACAVSRELGLDPERVNPNGSGISIGHPVGATGAINTVKLVYEMQRSGARRGLVTMCIGGGQGIAAVLERV